MQKLRVIIKQLLNEEFNRGAYLSWKRKNVTLRGMKEIGQENGGMAMLGQGLYTAFLGNKKMAKGYGTVNFVVNAIPRNPKVFRNLNEWKIWFQQTIVFPISKALGKNYPDSRDVNDIREAVMKLGYDGIVIKGREMVNYTPPDNIMYFQNEIQLEDYYERAIENESSYGI